MENKIIPPNLLGKNNIEPVFLWFKKNELIVMFLFIFFGGLTSLIMIISTDNFWWITFSFATGLLGAILTLPIGNYSLIKIIWLILWFKFSKKRFKNKKFLLGNQDQYLIFRIDGQNLQSLNEFETNQLLNDLTAFFNYQIKINIYKIDVPFNINQTLKYFQKENELAKQYFHFINQKLPGKINLQKNQYLLVKNLKNENFEQTILYLKNLLEKVNIRLLHLDTLEQQIVHQKIFFSHWNKIDTRLNHILVNKKYVRFISIQQLPKIVNFGWLNDLLKINNVDIKIELENLPGQKAIKKINQAINYYRSQLRTTNLSSLKITDINFYLQSLEDLKNSFAINQNVIKTFSIIFKLESDNLKKLNQKTREIKNFLWSKKYQPNTLLAQQFVALKSFIPNNIPTNLKNWFNVPADSISFGLPFSTFSTIENQGFLVGVDNCQNPVILNYDQTSDIKENNNINFLGTSGSGKTTAIYQIIANMLMSEKFKVFVIDPDKQFLNLLNFCPGVNLDVSNNEICGINPFHFFPKEMIFEKMELINGFFDIIFKNILDKMSMQKLNQIVHNFYVENYDQIVKKNNQLTFSKLYQLLEKLNNKEINPDVKFAVKQYVVGQQFGHLWDKQTNLNLANQLTIFDIKNLPVESEIFQAQIYLILRFIEQEILKNIDNGQNIAVVVDEVHLFLNTQTIYALKKLQNLSKRVRKYKACLITGTQNLQDYLNENIKTEATALINNASTLFVMKLKDADLKNLNQLLNRELLENEKANILTFCRGQSLLIRGQKRTQLDVMKIYE